MVLTQVQIHRGIFRATEGTIRISNRAKQTGRIDKDIVKELKLILRRYPPIHGGANRLSPPEIDYKGQIARSKSPPETPTCPIRRIMMKPLVRPTPRAAIWPQEVVQMNLVSPIYRPAEK